MMSKSQLGAEGDAELVRGTEDERRGPSQNGVAPT